MNLDLTHIIIVLVVVLVSMTMHEAMHAFASNSLGDDTAKMLGRLSFNPIRHIDPFLTVLLPLMLAVSGAPIFGAAKPVPFNPNNVRYGEWGSAIVALAGPITNLLIAFLIFGIWVVSGTPTEGLVGQVFITIVVVNLGFFIFNMIPIPPLDGSRVLYALAPEFFRRGMESVESYGVLIVFGIIFVAGSAFSDFFSTAIDFFMTVFARIYGL